MTKKEYNGWTNYETWVVNLWMDNEQAGQEHWLAFVSAAMKSAPPSVVLSPDEAALFAVADALKYAHDEAKPEINGVWADLIGAALSEVNWNEIAKNWIDKAKEVAA